MRFLDTSFMVALLRNRERHHDVARDVWRGNDEALLTTQGIVGEVWTLMVRREHHGAAVVALNAMQRSPRLTILETENDVHEAAWGWLRRHDEHEYSFVDAVSFEVMRRRRLTEALAFDGDFTRAGFVEVRP